MKSLLDGRPRRNLWPVWTSIKSPLGPRIAPGSKLRHDPSCSRRKAEQRTVWASAHIAEAMIRKAAQTSEADHRTAPGWDDPVIPHKDSRITAMSALCARRAALEDFAGLDLHGTVAADDGRRLEAAPGAVRVVQEGRASDRLGLGGTGREHKRRGT